MAMVKVADAAIQGRLPWLASQQRRSLLKRFLPNYRHFAGVVCETSMPALVEELTAAQQAVPDPPYIYNLPLIEGDGVSIIRPTGVRPDGTVRE